MQLSPEFPALWPLSLARCLKLLLPIVNKLMSDEESIRISACAHTWTCEVKGETTWTECFPGQEIVLLQISLNCCRCKKEATGVNTAKVSLWGYRIRNATVNVHVWIKMSLWKINMNRITIDLLLQLHLSDTLFVWTNDHKKSLKKTTWRNVSVASSDEADKYNSGWPFEQMKVRLPREAFEHLVDPDGSGSRL